MPGRVGGDRGGRARGLRALGGDREARGTTATGRATATCRSRRPRSARSARRQAVDRYTLSNGSMTVKIISYGGIIQELWAPDRRGRQANITLGYADLNGYTVPRGDPPTPNPSYFGGDHRPLRQPHRQARRSRSTARRTRSTPTTGPTASTAGSRASTSFVWAAESFKEQRRGRPAADPHERGGRGVREPADRLHGLPRQPQGPGRLHARQARQAAPSTTRRRRTSRRSSTSPTTPTGTCRARARGRSTTTGSR